jgi:hypothetical protein
VDRGTAGFVRRLLGQTIGQQKQSDQGDCGIEPILCDARDRCDDQEEQAELNDAASSH